MPRSSRLLKRVCNMIRRILRRSVRIMMFVLVFCFALSISPATTAVFATVPQTTISHITPNFGSNAIPVAVTILGTNFTEDTKPVLTDPNQEVGFVDLVNVNVVNETVIRAWVPANIAPITYDLLVIDEIAETTAVLERAYTAVSSNESDDLFVHDYEFWVSPPAGPQVSQPATIGIRVHRLGGFEPLIDVPVAFYEGENLQDPVNEGRLLGETSIKLLEPNGSASVSLGVLFRTEGARQIYAVVNPHSEILELSRLNNVATRHVTVQPEGNSTTPSIPHVTINNGNLATRERTVSIDLQFDTSPNNSTPRTLYYREYVFIQSAQSWVPVKQSGWLILPGNATDFSWELHDTPGIHYMLVWTADANGNISTQPGRQFINYLPETSTLLTNEAHLYRWPLQSGEKLQVRITSLSGDADLYTWNPDGSSAGSSQTTDPIDEVIITATQSGMHQIEIDGTVGGQYQLEIIPLAKNKQSMTSSLSSRPKGRVQPYLLPPDDPDNNAPLPNAPKFFLNLPIIVRKSA